MSKLIEEWKPIKGYEGLYEVSDWGRVKSLDRILIQKCRWGSDVTHLYPSTILMPSKSKGGYMRVRLSKLQKARMFFVHVLVWEAFNGDKPKGMQVNHIDEDKANNVLWNLNLMTPKENTNYGTCISRRVKTRMNNPNIFEHVDKIDIITGEILEHYISAGEASRKNKGFSQNKIRQCCNGGYFDNRRNKWVNTNQYKGFGWRFT